VSLARNAAEALFAATAKKPPAPAPMQDAIEASLPPALRERCRQLPAARRTPAFLIVVARDLQARRRIWNAVPLAWRAEVDDAVGLMLGALLGTAKHWLEIDEQLLAYPEDLRDTARNYAREIYAKRSSR